MDQKPLKIVSAALSLEPYDHLLLQMLFQYVVDNITTTTYPLPGDKAPKVPVFLYSTL